MDSFICTVCGNAKGADQFYKNRRDCKFCFALRRRKLHRKRRIGWTEEGYDAAFESQHGKCAICEIDLVDAGKKYNSACADHHHASGKGRGILCNNCNRALGLLCDDPRVAINCAAYLIAHGETIAYNTK